eukprot:gnl/TRDRNA2_/TRDRNA2_103233_c0_seq1.p1 gnl/TRDRNA2_/TRDRNA2_103233_c0~~gnl/TRDRNA2_/TRDRNA2_103233_c0_seq1.p1  ORF type:complete len:590 (+),score=141.55 gnl/TRDRNA2_/TRDRNA2_103233_c0_seq1:112-1881(+)
MGDEGTDKQASKQASSDGSKFSPKKTYSRVLQHKEKVLAQEALAERRAVQLTRRFMAAQEQWMQAKLDKMSEMSARAYERSMQQVEVASARGEMVRRILKDEQAHINMQMKEKARERANEEENKRSRRSETQYYIEARSAHERQQARKRREAEEVLKQEKVDKLNRRYESVESAKKALRDEQAESEAEKEKKKMAHYQGVEARHEREMKEKRKAVAEMRKELNKKVADSVDRKQAHFEGKSQSAREANEKKQILVAEQNERFQRTMKERYQKMIDKSTKSDHDEANYTRRLTIKHCQPIDGLHPEVGKVISEAASAPAAPSGSMPQARPVVATEEKTSRRAEGRVDPSSNSPWSKDLQKSKNAADKEYVNHNADLDRAMEDMLVKKKYKEIAAKVGDSKASEENDIRTSRMKSVHSMYNREKSTDALSSRSAPSRVVPRNRPTTCGLCGGDFPLEGQLPGKAMMSTISKLQTSGAVLTYRRHDDDQRHNLNRRAVQARSLEAMATATGAAAQVTAPSPSNRAESSLPRATIKRPDQHVQLEAPDKTKTAAALATDCPQEDVSIRVGNRLYDYAVPLCGPCWQFCRVQAA